MISCRSPARTSLRVVRQLQSRATQLCYCHSSLNFMCLGEVMLWVCQVGNQGTHLRVFTAVHAVVSGTIHWQLPSEKKT